MVINFGISFSQSVADQIIQAVGCLCPPSDVEDEVQIIEEKLVNIPNAKNISEARIGSALRQATVRSRHLHFLSINRQSVLSYCTRLLIHILKDRSLQPAVPGSDAAIGHVIVLLQVNC